MQKTAKVQSVERDLAIDATRGIAILAVVLFHVTRGFESSGWLPPSDALLFADTFAYSFHVATFFLIAGYLAFPRAGQTSFQLQRQTWFYHAYLLWSLVSWTLVAAINGAVNNPVGLRDLLFIPIVPIQHFWFLLSLMLGMALLYVLRTPWALLGGIVAALVLEPWLTGLPSPWGAMISLSMVLTGGLIRASGVRLRANLPVALLCVAIVAGSVLWRMMQPGGAAELFAPLRALVALCGCYAAYSFASLAGNGRIGAVLAYFGRHSLVIFLLHVIAGSGLRIILSRMMPGLDASIAIPLVLIASLAFPLLFQLMAQRVGAEGWLGLRPLFKERRTVPAEETGPDIVLAPVQPATER